MDYLISGPRGVTTESLVPLILGHRKCPDGQQNKCTPLVCHCHTNTLPMHTCKSKLHRGGPAPSPVMLKFLVNVFFACWAQRL